MVAFLTYDDDEQTLESGGMANLQNFDDL